MTVHYTIFNHVQNQYCRYLISFWPKVKRGSKLCCSDPQWSDHQDCAQDQQAHDQREKDRDSDPLAHQGEGHGDQACGARRRSSPSGWSSSARRRRAVVVNRDHMLRRDTCFEV